MKRPKLAKLPIPAFPVTPKLPLNFSKLSVSLFLRKRSSETIHPIEAAGNTPYLFEAPNLEEPSYRKLALNKYLSIIENVALEK